MIGAAYIPELPNILEEIHKSSFVFFTASFIKICNRKDPEINNCVLNSIEQLRSKLKIGIPELEVPAIEPFTLKHVRLLRGPQAARLDINLTNIQVIIIYQSLYSYYLQHNLECMHMCICN